MKNTNLEISNQVFSFVIMALAILILSGCSSSQYYSGTPVVKKHAKRGYNKSYKIKGKKYYPKQEYEYSQVGKASYYGGRDVFHGRKTSTGERFNKNGLTAAHKTLPLPSVVRVTNLKNGRTIKLRINDRGPFVSGRIIDVSEKSAKLLGFHHDGIAKVKVECLVGESMLLARSYNPNNCNPYTVHGGFHDGGGSNIKQAIGIGLSKIAGDIPTKPLQVNLAKKPSGPAQDIRGLSKGTYIQVGTYSSVINANNFAYKVKTRMRVPCSSYEYAKGSKKYYRVLVGPMNNRAYADNMLQKLKARNVTDAFIVTNG